MPLDAPQVDAEKLTAAFKVLFAHQVRRRRPRPEQDMTDSRCTPGVRSKIPLTNNEILESVLSTAFGRQQLCPLYVCVALVSSCIIVI